MSRLFLLPILHYNKASTTRQNMYLCEEYLLRHKIDLPLVRHVRKGSFFFRNEEEWRVLTIDTIKSSHHPHEYSVSILCPIYDGANGDALFIRDSHWRGYFDQYESYMLRLAEELKQHKPVVGHKNAILSGWEIFLFTHDSWVTVNLSEDAIYKTIDLDLSIEDRYLNMQEILSYMRNNRKFLELWEASLQDHLCNYCSWFGDLILTL